VPIYEYSCDKCGDQFEHLQGFSDKPLRKCRKCGGRLKKLVSECSFHLKGSGWYVTDYGGKKSGGNGKPKKEEAKPVDKKPKKEKKNSEKTKQTTP
jgi:putative FmdB family regulatory protein